MLEIRQDGGGSSAQKSNAIARSLSRDSRIRGALIYGGAPATLRWSIHGAQLQNLPRHDSAFNVGWILRDLVDGATVQELGDLHGPPLKICSELLRPVLIAAPGLTLVTADYSQIEARVLAWLAGQDDRLDVFRAFDAGKGPDPYRVTAGRIYQTSPDLISPERRKIGKVADLALGYQGGSKAFKGMAKNFGLKVPTKQAEETNRLARRPSADRELLVGLNCAAKECIAQPPGEVITVGRLAFRRNRRALTLGCRPAAGCSTGAPPQGSRDAVG